MKDNRTISELLESYELNEATTKLAVIPASKFKKSVDMALANAKLPKAKGITDIEMAYGHYGNEVWIDVIVKLVEKTKEHLGDEQLAIRFNVYFDSGKSLGIELGGVEKIEGFPSGRKYAIK